MSKNTKKVGVFMSSGIGNAVMLVPLLKLLKEKSYSVTIIITSPFIDINFIEFNNFPYHEVIELKGKEKLRYILTKIKHFDNIYLDYSSSSVYNIVISSLISKKVVVLRKQDFKMPFVDYVKAEIDTHAIVLNTRLAERNLSECDFQLYNMRLRPKQTHKELISSLTTGREKVFCVQVSSGNLKTIYKNWPVDYWVEFFDLVYGQFPEIVFAMIGDKNEIGIGQRIISLVKSTKVIDLIGKTTLSEASAIVNSSDAYIGLDSGFMHLAVAYGTPTFTLLGASSESFIGYHKFDSKKHIVVHLQLDCRPCHAWIGRNVSRYENPSHCESIECMTELKPQMVFQQFKAFLQKNKL